MAEDFSLSKMLSGPLSSVFWAKCLMYGFGIGFLIFVSVGVYRGYRQKPETTQQADSIVNHYYQPRSGAFGCATVRR